MKRHSFAVFASALAVALVGGSVQAADPGAAPPPNNNSSNSNSPNSSGPTSDNRAVAEMLFFTARGLMEAGRYSEACTKLGESYRLDAAAGTLLNLAVCHESEGRVASAWGEFRQALSDARKQSRSDREELAKEHIAKLEPDLPFLTIVVPEFVKVKDMEILRNGVALGSGGWGTELPIDPGKVDIVMRAPGYLPKTKSIVIQKRQHLSTTVDKLELAPIVETVAVDTGWTTKRKVGAGLFVAGLAGVGVGTYFGFNALSKRDIANDPVKCPQLDGEWRCRQDGADASSKALTSAWVSNIAFGVGGVALLTGTYLFITGKNNNAESAPTPSGSQASSGFNPRINVTVGPTAGGAQGALYGSF